MLHFGYWLLYLLLLTVIFAALTIQIGKSPVVFLLSPLVFLFVAPNLISFYSFYFLLFTKFLSRKKFPALIIFGIIFCLISAVSSQKILTTAYQEYAFKGFDLKVTDYLLKPFTFERFIQAVDRVLPHSPKKQAAPPKNFIFVKTENRLEKVALREIIYIEGMRDYRRIHTINKLIMTLQTFAEFERQISPNIICRVHKSYMVSLDKIDSIEKDRIKIKDFIIPISETYKQNFFALVHRSAK